MKKPSNITAQSQSTDCSVMGLNAGNTRKELTAYPATPWGAGTSEASASHTCLTNNYSITEMDKGIETFSDDEKNKEYLHYKEKIEPTLGSSQYKHKNRMQHTVEQIALSFGHGAIGVLHLTLPNDSNGNPPSFDHANRCLNSYLTNVMQERYKKNYLIVCERGGRYGRVHFHILFVMEGSDFLTGSFKRKQGNKNMFYANEDCKREFNFHQGRAVNYGFGKVTRVEPLWDISKGAKYFSKYVGKGHYGRNEEMKGRQLIRYGEGFQRWHTGVTKTCKLPDGSTYKGAGFTKCNGAGRDRRIVYEMLSPRYGVTGRDKKELAEIFGSKWEYYAGDQMRFMCAMAGVRLLPKSTVDWLKGYLWNQFKLQLITQRRGKFYHEVFGAYRFMIKESEARNWVGRSGAAPDDVYEKTELLPVNTLRKYAWRNLCAKIESDAMGDPQTFNDLPIVDGLYNLKQYTKNETERSNHEQIARNSETSIEPDGQSKIDWHSH